MSHPTDRKSLIRLASTLPVGSEERRVLLRLVVADKANTPAGAKALYKSYLDGLKNPSDSKRTVKDFYSKGEGGDVAKDWDAVEKGRGKRDKGEEKTKDKQDRGETTEWNKKKNREVRNEGRDTALKKLKTMSDDDLKGALQQGLEDHHGNAKSVETALKRHKGDFTKLLQEQLKGLDMSLPKRSEKWNEDKVKNNSEFQTYISTYIKKEKGKKASDRSVLIRLASSLPVGSDERRAILAGLEKTSLTGEADYFFDWAKDLCWYIADALRSTPMSTMRKAPDGEIVVVREKPSKSAVAGNGREKGGEQGESVGYENHIYLWDKEGNKYTLRFYSYITRNPDTFNISIDGGQEAGTAIDVDVNQYDSPREAWTALRRAIAKASTSKRLRPYSRTGPHVEIK